MNPAEWLRRAASRTPKAPALLTGDMVVSDYAAFARAAAGIGAGLIGRGIGKGDRVAIFMANRIDYLEVMYGIWWIGAVAVPINAKLHPKEAEWIIRNADAALVFSDDKLGAGLQALPLDTSIMLISVDHPDHSAMRATSPLPSPTLLDGEDLIWLFYTSGTTGQPKGVMMTCGMLASMAHDYFIDVDDVSVTNAILYAAPMSHGAGIYNFMHVLRGTPHVVPQSGGFDPAEILRLGRSVGNISMFAAPTMVRRLVDEAKATGQDGEGLKTIIYAGGPMYEADILEAVEVIRPRFVQIYGQGECPMGITALSRHDVADRRHPRWRERLNSVGTAQSGVYVRVLDKDGADVPPGTSGEIAVRGATVMAGYWKNPTSTQSALRDGWLWTGDMGQIDADGYLTLQDRSKDMIISGGSNIYPREVEEVLLTHPAVHEAAVVGRPDPEWGEEVVAFVVLQDGQDARPDELDQLCLDRIARFKRPKDYHFVEALPKNNYGKVQKTDLRKWLKEETS